MTIPPSTKIVPVDETCAGSSLVIDEAICKARGYGTGLYGVGIYGKTS